MSLLVRLRKGNGFGERGSFRASCDSCTAVEEEWQIISVIVKSLGSKDYTLKPLHIARSG